MTSLIEVTKPTGVILGKAKFKDFSRVCILTDSRGKESKGEHYEKEGSLGQWQRSS